MILVGIVIDWAEPRPDPLDVAPPQTPALWGFELRERILKIITPKTTPVVMASVCLTEFSAELDRAAIAQDERLDLFSPDAKEKFERWMLEHLPPS